MIIREIKNNPDKIIKNFDWFNNFKDTHIWAENNCPDIADRLEKAYHKYLYDLANPPMVDFQTSIEKPGITGGKWRSRDNSLSDSSVLRGNDLIFNTSLGIFDKDKNRSNAKAASAVPDMIDALIEAYEWFGGKNRKPEWEVMESIEEALKKSGCKFL